MAFDLFQAPPVPGEAPNAPRPAPEPAAGGLDLFSRPPSRPTPVRPAPEPEPSAKIDLFGRPPSRPAPARPAPTPEPSEPSAPAEPSVEFTQEERTAFNQFAAPPKKFRNPDTGRQVLFRSLSDQEQARVRREWLQRFRQSQQQQQQQPEPDPVPEGFETVDNLDQFKPGDGFYEEGVRDGQLLRVREVRSDGLRAENGIMYYQDEIERQRGGGYLRKPAPKPEPEPESDRPRQRGFGPVESPDDLEPGDVLKRGDRYGSSRYWVVRKIGDKLFATEHHYGNFGSPREITSEFLSRDRGAERVDPTTVADYRLRRTLERGVPPVAGERVRTPSQMRRKGIMRVGDGDDAKQYYVSGVEGDEMTVQEFNPESGRPYGRPSKLTAQDLKDKTFLYVQGGLPRKRKPPGERIQRITGRMRPGRIVKVYFDKKPTWARVEAVEDGKITLQRVNARNGRNIGEPEELTNEDLGSWAHVRRIARIPQRLQPPPEPLVGPDGEAVSFAEKGKGELTPNFQPNRYDDVEISSGAGSADQIKSLLGDKLKGRDPLYVAADLAGAGGIASSLDRLSISVRGRSITVSGSGPGVRRMTRTISFDEQGNPKSISNSLFKVRGRRGRGIGTKMLATQVAMARELGFETLYVQAAGSPHSAWKGYYAWPALGYSAPFESGHWRRLPDEMKAKVLEVYPRKEGQPEGEMPQGLDFVHVMAAGKDVREWWRENGSGRGMRFPLGDDSLSVSALTKYVREKAEAAGVGADEFLQRAASLSLFALLLAAEDSNDAEVEEAPELTDEDEKILDKVWDEMRTEMIDGR